MKAIDGKPVGPIKRDMRRIKQQKAARIARNVEAALRAADEAPEPDLSRASADVRLGVFERSKDQMRRRSGGGS